MGIRGIFYRLIYFPPINYLLRGINKFFAQVLPKVKIPPSGILVFRLKNGKKIKLLVNQTSYVGYTLFWKGLYEYEYVSLFEKIIAKCRGFIDVGSNIGYYSIIAGKVSDNIRILSFDPTDAADYYIKKNIALNHLQSIITSSKLAVSNRKETLTFYSVLNGKYPFLKYNLGGASGYVNKPPEYRENKVQAISLDDYMEEHSLADMPVDFVKIDAEGAEPMVIRGMDKLIVKYKPIIVCELLSAEAAPKLETEFRKYAYGFYVHQDKKLHRISGLSMNADHYPCDCFFVHPSRHDLIEGFIS